MSTGGPMIRATSADGEEIIILFEIDGEDDLVLVRSVTTFPEEG